MKEMKKIVVNWFVDYDKEEKWLNEMSQNGWCLWHTNGYIYRFKECERGEYIFQIDYDEDYVNKGSEDYVKFRTSCGDIFVHEWDEKIYWKRRSIDGAFENGDNVASKLRLANKAFNHYFNRLTGLLYMGVFCLLLLPLLRLLPECWFSRLLIGICSDFPIVCLIVATAMLCPVVMKIRRKMNCLMRKLF